MDLVKHFKEVTTVDSAYGQETSREKTIDLLKHFKEATTVDPD